MVKLERRTCKCGCNRSWRCLPESTSEYYSWYECGGRTPNDGRLEFTGATSAQIKKDRAAAKRGTYSTRNFSRWDKRPGKKN